ncbi:MAG: hypothetical protein IPH53_19430 [Flavobacteriales bacterium]|nr:hypothetical protein [Flavobacteriales bacterium]
MRSIINIMGCCGLWFPRLKVQPAWSTIYQQAPNKSHVLNDLEVNDAGDIWLYGVADDTLGYPTGVVVKFSSFGFVEEWSHEFLDMGQASDIDIDAYNNVYVGTTDYDTIGSTSLNFMVRKIDDDGVLQWSAIRTGVGPNSYDRTSALCVDGLGNTIVTGCSAQPGWTNAWLTIKYDPNGNEVWAAILRHLRSGLEPWAGSISPRTPPTIFT